MLSSKYVVTLIVIIVTILSVWIISNRFDEVSDNSETVISHSVKPMQLPERGDAVQDEEQHVEPKQNQQQEYAAQEGKHQLSILNDKTLSQARRLAALEQIIKFAPEQLSEVFNVLIEDDTHTEFSLAIAQQLVYHGSEKTIQLLVQTIHYAATNNASLAYLDGLMMVLTDVSNIAAIRILLTEINRQHYWSELAAGDFIINHFSKIVLNFPQSKNVGVLINESIERSYPDVAASLNQLLNQSIDALIVRAKHLYAQGRDKETMMIKARIKKLGGIMSVAAILELYLFHIYTLEEAVSTVKAINDAGDRVLNKEVISLFQDKLIDETNGNSVRELAYASLSALNAQKVLNKFAKYFPQQAAQISTAVD